MASTLHLLQYFAHLKPANKIQVLENDPTLINQLALNDGLLFYATIENLRIDDVVGALPVHLLAGIWGTIAVPLSNSDTSFITQTVGTFSVIGFVFVVSSIVWFFLKAIVGVRPSEEEEVLGSDASEVGIEAYPYFK